MHAQQVQSLNKDTTTPTRKRTYEAALPNKKSSTSSANHNNKRLNHKVESSNQDLVVTHISDLPDELLLLIFKETSGFSVHNSLSLVCKRWRRLGKDNVLWYNLFIRKFGGGLDYDDFDQWQPVFWESFKAETEEKEYLYSLKADRGESEPRPDEPSVPHGSTHSSSRSLKHCFKCRGNKPATLEDYPCNLCGVPYCYLCRKVCNVCRRNTCDLCCSKCCLCEARICGSCNHRCL